MKIEKVHIKNIKGIKDLELSFKKNNKILDVIVLAGVNGSGKTTILESIENFFNNKNIDFNNIEKSNVNLDIFFEDFEKNNIEEAEKISINEHKYKLFEFFHMLSSYTFYKGNSNSQYHLLAKKMKIHLK